MVTETRTAEGLLIAGQRVQAEDGKTFETFNPATGEVIARVAAAGPADVDRAVRAARKAFEGGKWPAMFASRRGRLLAKAADLIRKRTDELAALETRNGGKTIRDSRAEVLGAAACFDYFAGAATRITGETIPVSAPGLDFTLREPVGVCAQIIPWNFPIVMAAWKIAPALACGCTVVLKPAGQTPLTALALGEILYEAGVPEGVVNVLPGSGSVAGEALIHHPLVDKIAFTGSTEVGKTIMAAAAAGIKRVSLELGGKSPNIVFADVDVPAVVDQCIYSVFANAGQDCCARSRFLVQESILEPFTQALAERTSRLRVGDPSDETTEMGAIISPQQLATVEGYVTIGREEGAELVCGGSRPEDEALSGGNFLLPTVLGGVRNDMRVAQEEIFGPVVAVIPFKDEDEAVRVANDTQYGLSGSIWTRDIGRALRVVRRVRTGNLSVNSNTSVHVEAPFGGFKMSGIGRELGSKALDLYTEVKNVYVATD
ncbi:MAG TPA: aldehyde dehydrogenase family protein [Chloroflexota bacterium]|nr:aldehyde dehydrogenase family protein [Chloroflexota bacterium]